MKYRIITYGCQMNHSDSERIASLLENIGYLPALKENEADLIVVNACSVRQSAIDRIWGQVNKFKKLKTILTGCVLKEDKKKFAKRFDLILNIENLAKWPEKLSTINNFTPHQNLVGGRQLAISNYLKIEPKYQNKFSAYVPIMTGCDNFCTFCAVPYTRGREVSRPAGEILCEIRNLVKRGYKEIWLLGQNVNSYRSRLTPISTPKDPPPNFGGGPMGQARNNGEMNFPKLLQMVNDIPGNFWIRFTSSHPKDFSNELVETMANCQKVTEYLNLPFQSGDNEILRKMNRPYTIEQYKEIIKKLRGEIPNLALSTDVIVGFPGETERQFQNTAKLFEEIKFDMAYIAQFSPRPGTVAAKIADDVPLKEKERRWKVLTDILRKTALEKNKTYIGKTLNVLVDYNPPTASSRLRRAPADQRGYLRGKTRTYKTVKFKGPQNLVGEFVKVRVIDVLPWGLKGEIKK